MKTLLLALFAFAISHASAFAATSTETLPHIGQISFPGNSQGYETELVKMKNGDYGIAVVFGYYVDPRTTESESLVFAPLKGVIHRVGDNLIWSVDGQDLNIAHTRWWYSTFVLNPGVSIHAEAKQNYSTGSGFDVFDVSADLVVE